MDKWNLPTIERVSWEKIRKDFKKVNPELGHIIDELSPDSSYTFYDACYPFGSEPLINGHVYIPDYKGNLHLLNSDVIDSKIQDDLSYNLGTNPVSLVLDNSFEIFMMYDQYTVPLYGLIPEGKVISTWRILKPGISNAATFLWNMTAGARSMFMLPKLTETSKHEKLCNLFDLNSQTPNKLSDHWRFFRELASRTAFGEKWSARILFFSKKWFEKMDDPKWIKFKTYLLQAGWEGSDFWRNQFVWDLAFSIIQKNSNIRPNPRNFDTVKHLLTIAVGAVPGFSPVSDENVAPIKRLQELYQTIYKLDYVPIVMAPKFYSMYEKSSPVYHSIEYPCSIEFSPSSRKMSNKITILNDVMHLLRKCLDEVGKNYLNLQGTPLFDVVNKVKFDAFHTKKNGYQGIRSSIAIPAEDALFLSSVQNLGGSKKSFPDKCPFMNGCIRISDA